MLIYILAFITAFVFLARSSDLLVRSLTNLARFFKFSEYLISFIFMSMATSIPELFVGISSSASHIPEFSLGNVFGANLLNITLVIGVVTLLGKGLHVDSRISRRNFWIISGMSFLPFLLASDGIISRGDASVLLLTFGFYLFRLMREREYFTKTLNHFRKNFYINLRVFKYFTNFLIGISLLILSSYIIVWAGKNLSQSIAVSAFSFGIIFVAFGTALPELAFGIRARLLKHGSMTIGNSLGSIAFNSTLIVALVSLITPIKVSVNTDLFAAAGFLFIALLLFNLFVYSKSFISRKEGFILLALYVMFLVFEYFTHTF